MSSDASTGVARAALGSLLRRLGIDTVVCVDDEHAPALSLDDMLAWFEVSTVDAIKEAFPKYDGGEAGDVDVRKAKFQAWWLALQTQEQESYAASARAFVQAEASAASPDTKYMSILSEVFDGMTGVKFMPLSPLEWNSQSASLLADAPCARTLFLFDQNMSKQGGRDDEGAGIVGAVLARGRAVRPLCGILTHTAAPESQVSRWQELAEQAGVERDSFMVIPKSLLTDDLDEFTRQMKAAALAPGFKTLKALSTDILTDALVEAGKELAALTVLDFDHMVMRVARGEGVWEGQVLFRLHSHFHRIASERKARGSVQLAALLERIRDVSYIPELPKSSASDAVRRIRHEELYEPGDSINSAHLDIMTGDVFEVTGVGVGIGARRWMVASQACDLAIRPDGTRNISQVLLLEVLAVSNSDLKRSRYLEMPYFAAGGSGEKVAVDFLSATLAPAWALDTCVLDSAGHCGIRLSATVPTGLLPGWAERFQAVLKEAKRLHDQCDVSCVPDEESRKALLTRLAPSVASCGTIKGEVCGEEVRLPFNRIARLRLEVAMDVVRAYAGYIARMPQEVDLARKA